MTTATITKTLNKIENQPSNYSIGYKRLASLPQRVKMNIIKSLALRGESSQLSIKDFLGSLTDAEFVNWMKLN